MIWEDNGYVYMAQPILRRAGKVDQVTVEFAVRMKVEEFVNAKWASKPADCLHCNKVGTDPLLVPERYRAHLPESRS